MNNGTKSRGVYPEGDLLALIDAGRIRPLKNFEKKHAGPASIDLTTTGRAYRVERILQPNPKRRERVEDLLPSMGATEIQLGSVLEVGASYLAKASFDLNFPPGMYGYFNAKSTSGRNFLFVRTLVDGMFMFDSADRRHEGYSGEVWLVIEPLCYPVILTDQQRYNQFRVFDGDTRFSQEDLTVLLRDHDLLFRRNKEPYLQGELSHFTHDGSVLCTLHAEGGLVGFKARQSKKPVDLSAARRSLDPLEHFEPVYAERLSDGTWGVSIEGGRYYLLSTQEMFKVPPHHTAELVALDRRLGDIFTYFAGFFDPGFFGTATLEVYSPRNVFLRHGQPFARFILEKCRSPAPLYGEGDNSYNEQVETGLPKQFAPWKD